MDKISLRCLNCLQPLEEIEMQVQHELKYHLDINDCLRALVKRVENLEYELMANKLPDCLSRSSDPGPPISASIPVVIPPFKDKK